MLGVVVTGRYVVPCPPPPSRFFVPIYVFIFACEICPSYV